MCRGNRLQPLSGLDSLFLHLETPETPMHVASLHLFDLPEGYRGDFHANLKQQVARRLHLVPLFRRRLHTLPLAIGNPVWVEDADVDLDYHVRRVRLPRPGTQAQLEACAARIHSTLMDRRRPLWEAHVIEGLQTGQVGLYMRVHHAVLDGAAGMALAGALLDPTPEPRDGAAAAAGQARGSRRRRESPSLRAPRSGTTLPSTRGSCGSCPISSGSWPGPGRHARDPAAAPARRSRAFGPRTPLNVSITGERSFAAVSLPLDEVKRVARAHDAKLNDVVLAICSGALRQLSLPSRRHPAGAAHRRDAVLAARSREHGVLDAGDDDARQSRDRHRRPGAAAAGDSRCGGCDQVGRGPREVGHSHRYAVARRAVARWAGWRRCTDDRSSPTGSRRS